MALRIQLGNPRASANASCYVPLGGCKLARVAAFNETSEVARLFYGLLFEALRSWVSTTYLQVWSSDSWWGRRGRDLALAPKLPLRSTPNDLLYEIGNADELGAFIDTFWRRSPLRIYGTMHSELCSTTLDSVLNQGLVDTCKLLVEDELRFVVERDTWGFFPNILFRAIDIGELSKKLEDAARVLSSPLQSEEAAFDRFPLRFPAA
jgi:hypothetical protein